MNNKPFPGPLIDFIEEHWSEFVGAYAELGIDKEADAVLEWLKEQEGVV